jgi:hypothetical protein
MVQNNNHPRRDIGEPLIVGNPRPPSQALNQESTGMTLITFHPAAE